MRKISLLILGLILIIIFPSASSGKELPKVAVWDLIPREVKSTYAQELTSILVSEISKLEKYEVYSQDNVRTLAGWTAERMQLGCTDTKCLTALGQMDVAKLISGSVGKIGNRYSVSLNLFDTQNARAEKSVSEFSRSEDELIDLVQVAVRKLLGESLEVSTSAVKKPSKEFKDPITGMEFIFVKGGCYEMGDTFGDGHEREKPVHEVCVDDFYLGKYEVTVGEFRKFVDSTGYRTEAEKGDGCLTLTGVNWKKDRNANWRSPGFPINDKHPVVCVSWNDAVAFARWMEGRGGKTYRLPTEAEWEYAARDGGKKMKYSWGDGEPSGNIADESAKRRIPNWSGLWDIWSGYDDGYAYTAPVGSFRPNGLGMYDMMGNVWEWCADWYDRNYYQNSPKDNPRGPGNGQKRLLRGGSWFYDPWNVRATNRFWLDPADPFVDNGFRLGASAR
ncbi:MAG: formylglycine-generating enzyme family protein [Thermodesulfobacteriota bacterium]